MVLDREMGDNEPYWGMSLNGKFTINSAYIINNDSFEANGKKGFRLEVATHSKNLTFP